MPQKKIKNNKMLLLVQQNVETKIRKLKKFVLMKWKQNKKHERNDHTYATDEIQRKNSKSKLKQNECKKQMENEDKWNEIEWNGINKM